VVFDIVVVHEAVRLRCADCAVYLFKADTAFFAAQELQGIVFIDQAVQVQGNDDVYAGFIHRFLQLLVGAIIGLFDPAFVAAAVFFEGDRLR